MGRSSRLRSWGDFEKADNLVVEIEAEWLTIEGNMGSVGKYSIEIGWNHRYNQMSWKSLEYLNLGQSL